ncbi:DUF2779 domain-containing protein [Campylobacter sp. MOP7]|uniref:DUF2779 domain-containing protein n=1 Tax=Campylobacter canis TaxID=3378588 RepID=UPI00387E71E7
MLSKSQYTRGLQCPKSLWLYKFRRYLENKYIDNTKFEIGNEVGRLAQEYFKGGILIEFDPSNFESMAERTKELIDSGAKIIYEATFISNGVFAMADILVKNGSEYEIYEVKSSTSVKDYHIDDISVQWYCISSVLPLKKACIMHIDNSYERVGKINLNELFHIEDITNIVIAKQDEVRDNLTNLNNMLSLDEPDIKIGTQCYSPFECSFSQHCFKDVPEISILNLYRINQTKAYDMYHNGIVSYEDILKSDISLTETQRLQVSTNDNSPYIDKSIIDEFISNVKYPINFLDFETFQDAIPRFDHQRPYAQVTFQYSLHILHEDGRLEHFEFLGDGVNDPRQALAKDMLKKITKQGSIMAYNMSFEKSRIKELAELLLELKDELLALNERFIDLLVPFRSLGYYDKNFHGSFSIKSVLPALFPNNKELSYKELDIQNGGDASSEYANLIYQTDKKEIEKVRQNLLKYCHLDTLAMVEIFKKLQDQIKTKSIF